MALELVSEETRENRKVEVYKHTNRSGYTIKCFEDDVNIQTEVVRNEAQMTHFVNVVWWNNNVPQEIKDLEEEQNATEGTPPPHLEV